MILFGFWSDRKLITCQMSKEVEGTGNLGLHEEATEILPCCVFASRQPAPKMETVWFHFRSLGRPGGQRGGYDISLSALGVALSLRDPVGHFCS